MRLSGVPNVLRFQGVVTRLGSLPQNEVNPLSPNVSYSQVVASETWNRAREIVAKGYGDLPYAPAGTQIPWNFRLVGDNMRVMGSPPPIIPPGAVSTSSGGGGGGKRRTQLHGLGETPAITAFPYSTPQPSLSSNLMWYSGPIVNIGDPKYSNDANEYLRHAMIESDWTMFEKWLGWAFENGMTPERLKTIDFGKMKWAGNKNYPFSEHDIYSFFDHFLKYASGTPVNANCLRTMKDRYLAAARSHPSHMYRLQLSDCPIDLDFWKHAFPRLVAVAAIPYAAATLATLAVGGAAAAGAGGTAAAGGVAAGGGGATAGGIAAGGAASLAPAAAIVPAGIEIVTVAATALPVISAPIAAASAGAALASGALIATSTPPAPLSQPTPTAQPTQAEPVIETVTVEASAIPPPPPPPLFAASAIPGVTQIALDVPNIQAPEPPTPEYQEEPTLTDRIKDGLTDALEQAGADYVSAELEQYLQDLIGRPPTQTEIEDWSEWIDTGANPATVPRPATPLWVWLLLGGTLAYAAYRTTKKRRR